MNNDKIKSLIPSLIIIVLIIIALFFVLNKKDIKNNVDNNNNNINNNDNNNNDDNNNNVNANGDISSYHIRERAKKYNCIFTLYIFRSKPHKETMNSIKSGHNRELIDYAISIGVPVYTAIVTQDEYIATNSKKFLGNYGISGAHIISRK